MSDPILSLTGSTTSSSRPWTMILAARHFEKAYHRIPSTRSIRKKKLIGQRNRTFLVGFSFSDPWFEFISNRVIRHTAALSSGEPRHVAIIGLSAEEEQTLSIHRSKFLALNSL